MIINPLLCDITHARRLLKSVADCGIKPPESLTTVIEGLDSLTAASTPVDPTQQLIRGALEGGPAQAEKMLAEYAVAKLVAEERKNLRGKLDPHFLEEFCDRLENGGADAILNALRPEFDTAAQVIAKASAIVDVTASADTIISEAGADELTAWQSIPAAVQRLNELAAVAAAFGPQHHAQHPFTLIDRPHNIEFGWARSEAIMCTSGGLLQDSRAFACAGTDVRKSAWLRVTPHLNTIVEARERVRQYAENAWASINAGQAKRGRITETGDVAWDQVHNPFAQAER